MARIVASTLLVLGVLWAIALPALPCAGDRSMVSAAGAAIGRLICHQRADRSFASCGRPWAVCGRCAGLYLGAMAGAIAAAAGVGRHDRSWRKWRTGVVGAAVPTAVLWSAEMAGLWDPGTLVRSIGALPLGAATAAWLAAVARGDLR